MIKYKESLYLKHWDVNNLYRWAMGQKLFVNGFKWAEETSQFNESFMESYNEEIDEGYFPKVDVKYPEMLHEPHNALSFSPERMKIQKVKNL